VIWGGIIDGSMEMADVANLAVSEKKGRKFFIVAWGNWWVMSAFFQPLMPLMPLI
jgi:hypothetical protein